MASWLLLPGILGSLSPLLAGTAYAQQEPRLVVPIGHTNVVSQACISPNGKRVATAGAEGKVMLWDLATGMRLAELPRNDHGQAGGIAFSPDGTRVLELKTTYQVQDGGLPLWDASTGKLLANLKQPADTKQAEFSPDGKHVVTGDGDGNVGVWDAGTGRVQQTWATAPMLNHVHYSPDGLRLVTANARKAMVWNAATGQLVRELNDPAGKQFRAELRDAFFSPDGSRLVTVAPQKAQVWDASSGKLLAGLDLGQNYETLLFNAGGDALLSVRDALDSGKAVPLKLWNAATGSLIATLWAANEAYRFAHFSPDGRSVVVGSSNPEVTVWSVASGRRIYSLKGHRYGTQTAAITPDGTRLVVAPAAADASTKVWNLQTGKLEGEFSTGHAVYHLTLGPDGKKAAIATGAELQVWDLGRRQLEARMRTNSTLTETIEIGPDRKMLITRNQNPGSVRLWNPATGDLLAPALLAGADAQRLVYSASYRKALKVSAAGDAPEIWDTRKGAVQAVLDKFHAFGLGLGVFTPDEKKLVTTFGGVGTPRVCIWDAETGALLKEMEDPKGQSTIKKVIVSPNGAYAVTCDEEGHATSWNLESGQLIGHISGAPEMTTTGFLGTSQWFITAEPTGEPRLWDAKTAALIMPLKGHKGPLLYALSPDRKRLLTWPVGPDPNQPITDFSQLVRDSVARLWDLDRRGLLAALPGHKGGVEGGLFSADGKCIVTLPVLSEKVRVWDGHSGRPLRTLRTTGVASARTTLMSKDGKFLFTSSSFGKAIEKWDLATGRRLLVLRAPPFGTATMAYDGAAHELLVGGGGGALTLWNAETGAVKRAFAGHQENITAACFGPKDGTLITASFDYTMKVWNRRTGTLIYTFFPVGDADYINLVAGGYYKGSAGAARRLHYVTEGLRPISFEQLDVKYNRPDKVLRALGNADPVLLGAYRRAYEKRIRSLGLDTTQFRAGYAAPLADIRNRDALAYDQTQPTLRLEVGAHDPLVLLDRMNVWVNEVPLFGAKGISLRGRHLHTLDTTIAVSLSVGANRLEFSAVNAAGTESYRQPLLVRYTPTGALPEEKLHFIGIGLNEFAEQGYRLAWCVKDIRDLARGLKSKYGSRLVVDTLFNAQVTVASVRALGQRLRAASIHDKVVLAYSGHGLFSKDYDYYLSTYGVSFANPEAQGLAYEELEKLLDQTPARRKLMLLDACHSGEIDREELARLPPAAPPVAAVAPGGRGAAVVAAAAAGTRRLGLANSFELMRQLFVNVGRSTGATVISAAGGLQFAQEQNRLRNGVFSYSVLEFMRANPKATVSALKQYVIQRVSDLTAGLQVPTTRNEPLAVDWQVW